jgi:crotonobetainyl-CoA:carnitine CoA-transferase CaiB-like acyl-CoA transferase
VRANTRTAASSKVFRFSSDAIERSVNAAEDSTLAAVQPLAETLVVDLTRLLPGAYASRELLRLGARVVRVEAPDGDPMRTTAPAWDAALRAGTESVVCDLKTDAGFARALCSRADVVLEGFRPGVAERLGIGPADVPDTVVYCSITGFGHDPAHVGRVGHDLNYLGWAGVLEDTPTGAPPVQVADLSAGALGAVTRVLAALLEREKTGRGQHLVVSMTHGAHDLVAHRTGGDPVPRLLTGGLACYRAYATADGRHLTVGALEPKFFARLCELLGRPELAERQYELDQESLAAALGDLLGARPLAEWLERFEGEDVCVGPVWTREEAAEVFGGDRPVEPVPLGAHTAAWRGELAGEPESGR